MVTYHEKMMAEMSDNTQCINFLKYSKCCESINKWRKKWRHLWFGPKRTETPPQKVRREDLLEKYHSLLKEKKELRKRNAQAQTNICQYLRKHNIDLFPHLEADKSQVHMTKMHKYELSEMLENVLFLRLGTDLP